MFFRKKLQFSLIIMAILLSVGLMFSALATETTPGTLTYEEVITPQYQAAKPFSEELAAVQLDGLWGYIDQEGETVIPFSYSWATSFSEGCAVVGQQVGTGYTLSLINHQGETTALLKNNQAVTVTADQLGDWYMQQGYIRLPEGSSWGLYDTAGQRVSTTLTPSHSMTEGLVPVYSEDNSVEVGYVDESGQLVLHWNSVELFGDYVVSSNGSRTQSFTFYNSPEPFNQGLAPLWYGTADATQNWAVSYLLGFIDTTGNWVIEPQYTNCFITEVDGAKEVFGETGLAMVQNQEGYYGAIDKEGNTVISFDYEELRPYSEGMAAFCENGRYGYLGEDGQVTVTARFQEATNFSGGYAAVYDGTSAYLINRWGQKIDGSDNLDKDTYFQTTSSGEALVVNPGEYVVIEAEGRYGFGAISYYPPLPVEEQTSSWAFEEVLASAEAGLIPTELQCLYQQDMTRSEFCTLLVQVLEQGTDQTIQALLLEQTGKSLYEWIATYPFTDTTDPDVIAIYALGIAEDNGTSQYRPYNSINRQTAANYLYRTAEVLGMDTQIYTQAEYSDLDLVNSWSKNSVFFVSERGIMGGVGNNQFDPTGSYSREQAFLTVYRLMA